MARVSQRAGFEWVPVPAFGGGLNFAVHPAKIRPDEWSWAQNFYARDGYAECAPGYQQLADVGFTSGLVGICPSAFSAIAPVVVARVNDGSGVITLKTVRADSGAVSTVAWDGVGTQPLGASGSLPTRTDGTALHTGFINGVQIFSLGLTGRAASSLIRWNGGATFANLGADATAIQLQAHYLATYGGRVVLASTFDTTDQTNHRKIRWSDLNVETVWTPDVSNSADFAYLDEVDATPLGLLRAGWNVLGILTRKGLYVLQPTASLPAFNLGFEAAVRGESDFRSAEDYTPDFITPPVGETAHGVYYGGADNLYRIPREPVGTGVFKYVQKQRKTALGVEAPFYVAHETRGALLMGPQSYNDRFEFLAFHAGAGGAWSRIVPNVPTGQILRAHCFAWENATAQKPTGRHYLLTDLGLVYQEKDDASTTPGNDAFIDTKDFGAGDFPWHVHGIRVELEPLTNKDTDAVEIFAYARNELSPELASPGLESDYTAQFVSLGTVTAGAGGKKIRRRGRYTRFRLKRTSGRCRIRALHVLVRKGSGRLT